MGVIKGEFKKQRWNLVKRRDSGREMYSHPGKASSPSKNENMGTPREYGQQ